MRGDRCAAVFVFLSRYLELLWQGWGQLVFLIILPLEIIHRKPFYFPLTEMPKGILPPFYKHAYTRISMAFILKGKRYKKTEGVLQLRCEWNKMKVWFRRWTLILKVNAKFITRGYNVLVSQKKTGANRSRHTRSSTRGASVSLRCAHILGKKHHRIFSVLL